MGAAFGHALAGHAGAYGKYKSKHKRFTRWAEAGVWDRAFEDLLRDGESRYVMIDSSVVRAHQQAASARKRCSGHRPGAESRRSDDQDPLLASPLGLSLAFNLTGGQTHDCTHAIPLLGDRQPEAVIADKGDDTDLILNHLKQNNIAAVIPPRKRASSRAFDRTLYRQRNRIERTFSHLSNFAASRPASTS